MRRTSPRFEKESVLSIAERKARLFSAAQKFSQVLLQDKKFDMAVWCYDHCLLAEPDSVLVLTGKKELLITLAKLHYQNSEFDKCLQYFKAAMAIKVSHINFSREIAKGLLDLANHYAANGNYELAISCFSESSKANTDDKQVKIEALLGCSRAIIRTRRLDHCMSLLSSARELIGDDKCPQFKAALYEYRGLKYRRSQDFEGAIKIYKKLLAIEPENIIGLSGLGVLCRSGEPALALSCIEKALVLQPNSLKILGIKAMYHKGHHEFDEELDCYNHILQLQPDNYSIKQHRIGLFHRRERATDDAAREPRAEISNPRPNKKQVTKRK